MNTHLRSFYVLDEPHQSSFAELSVVRTIVDLVEGEFRVPKGAVGTIVHVYIGKDAYVVEFPEFEAVVDVHAREIEAV